MTQPDFCLAMLQADNVSTAFCRIVGVLDKIQCIKASSAALGTPRPAAAVAAANESKNDGPDIRKTSTVYSGNDDGDDDDLSTIEELLYITLKREDFAIENSSLDHRVQEVEKGASSIDYSRSVSDDSLSSRVVLLGGGDLNASDSEVFDSNLRTESAEPDTGSSSSLETAYDIDNYSKTVQRLQLAEGALTSNSICPYSPSSCLSSQLLHDRIDTDSLDTHCARSEAATSHSACPRSPPPHCSRELRGNWLGQEDRLHASQSTADEREYEDELVCPALNTDTFDKGKRQQRAAETGGKVDKDDNEDDSQPHQRVNSVAAVLTTERVGDTHLSSKGDESVRPAKRQRPLSYSDSSPDLSYNEVESYSDSYCDDELNNAKAKLDKDDERPRPAKRKRSSSSYDGPTQWNRKNYLQVAAGSSAEGQLPSPVPSALQATTDTDVLPDCCNSSPRDVLPMLVEVTFRPHFLYCCSFTAVIRDGCDGRGVSFGQLAQLIESIGHVGKIDDFTIKPIEHHSFLLTGFSQYTSSQLSFGEATLSTAVEAGCNYVDAMRTRLQNSRAVDARALALRRSELPSSGDSGSLSDSDLESSSDDDGCLSMAEQGHSSTSKRSR
ncbi:MAG: hypothetical protein M1813_001687 [Trichoglossum hirsutum]|nr:MAG: hypothetical protein M1813_001687 [Trichoglossum hirsutum]